MTSLLALIQRSHNRQPLSPPERAVLKFLSTSVIYAGVASLMVLGQVLLAHGAVTAPEAAMVFGIVLLGSFTTGIAKFLSAQSDSQREIGAALALVSDEGVQALCLAAGLPPTVASAIAAAVRGMLGQTNQPSDQASEPVDRFGQ